MFIETAPITLNVNTPVELTISRKEGAAHRLYRLPALVVRVVVLREIPSCGYIYEVKPGKLIEVPEATQLAR